MLLEIPEPVRAKRAGIAELLRLGLVDKHKSDSKRSLTSKYRRELIAANWMVCSMVCSVSHV